MRIWTLFMVFLVLLFGSGQAQAQKVEVTPFYGYQFGGEYTIERGHFTIPGAANYGFTVDIPMNDEFHFEFYFSRQETALEIRERGIGIKERLFDMNVEYYHGGVLYEFNEQEKARPFFTLTAGATRFDPKPSEISSEWRFSLAGGGGVKLFVSDHIGFRLQGHLLFPFLFAGGSFWCSLPGGCLVGLDAITSVQVAASAGIIFAF